MIRRNLFVPMAAALLCGALNNLTQYVFFKVLHIPLYLDTVWVVADTLVFGPVWGLITAAITDAGILLFLGGTVPDLWFYLCFVAAVVLTDVFHRRFLRAPADSPLSTITALFLLVIVMTLAMSVLGGLIAYLRGHIAMVRSASAENYFKLGLLVNGFPGLAAEILARIPINIVDRTITVFAGWGVYCLSRRFRLCS